jgi:dipeptidyl aminopeptidase/acylaminoacyl peptidase
MRSRLAMGVACVAAVAAALASAGASAPEAFPGPNGKIALSHGLRADNPGLDLVNPDGSGRMTLRTPGGYAPVWSADGRWLAYSTFPEPWVIRVARADGTGDREVLPAGAAAPATWPTEYAWSPTGSEIAYKCPSGLCAVRVADGKTRQIVQYQSPGGGGTSWSPDGSKIAFTCPGAVLCLVSPGGTNLEGFVGQPGLRLSGCCDWSPDGTRLLLTGRTTVYSLDVDDGELRELVDMGGETNVVIRARWAPDGRAVLIRRFPSVYLARLDGSAPTKLVDGDLGDWGTSPALTVTSARFEPRWVLSRQTGSLRLSGTASHASDVSVAIRSPGRTYPSASVSVRAGEYAVSTLLPRDLLPGPLEVVVSGTSGSEPLLAVIRPETLPAPATGLVSRSWIGLTRRGAPRARVPRGTTKLFAQFAFSVRPAAGQRLRAVWLAPSGATRATVSVRSARIVSASVTSDLGLQRGRWRCRLEAGRTPLAIASVRVG